MEKTDTHKRTAGLFCLLVALLALNLIFPGNSKATDLPVIHKSGTLAADETWTAGSVYMIDSTVTVPDGVTLTLDADVIVKYPYSWSNNGIAIQTGGEVDVNGNSNSPVIFTSSRDDSYGGDSDGNGDTTGALNDYYSAVSGYGGTLNLQYAVVKNANTAITASDLDLSVLDSEFSNMYTGINLNSGSAPSEVDLQRNHFSAMSSNPIYVANVADLTGLRLAGSDKNTFSGSGPYATVAIRDAIVPTSTTWEIAGDTGTVVKLSSGVTVNGALQVDTGAVLVVGSNVSWQLGATVYGSMTVQQGAIIKNINSQGIRVDWGATLAINGTTDDPVIFTSIQDDTVGGDTAGDGTTTGQPGNYTTAISSGGTVTASHAVFRYANNALSGNSSDSIAITDSDFVDNYGGIYLSGSPTTPNTVSLQRNHFVASSYYPITVDYLPDATGIVLSGADANTFGGSGITATVAVQNATVPTNAVWQLSATTGAVLRVIDGLTVDGTMDVGSGSVVVTGSSSTAQRSITVNGTLTIAPGAVIKNCHSRGISVELSGTLNASGTSANPIVFTSIGDDSVGGDTESDGQGTVGTGDYTNALVLGNGSAAVSYASFRYANVAISGFSGSLDLADSDFSDIYQGVDLGGADTCPNVISLKRNHFAAVGQYAVRVNYANDLLGLVLTGADKNTFSGGGVHSTVAVQNATVPSGKTWVVSPDSGAILKTIDNLTVAGTMEVESGMVFVNSSGYIWTPGVHVQGQLTIEPGVVLKLSNTQGFEVQPNAILNILGTSTDPITVTSLNDDTIGGDTNSDGATTVATGDYGAAITMGSGAANIQYANFRYGNSAVQGNSATLSVTDSTFVDNYRGIYLNGNSVVPNTVALARNSFTVNGDNPVYIDYIDDVTPIKLSGPDTNIFNGSGRFATVALRSTTVPQSTNWNVGDESNSVVRLTDFTVNGNVEVDPGVSVVISGVYSSSYAVSLNGNMTLGAGSIVKSVLGQGINIASGAQLDVNGTSSNPVTFTSLNDDTIGGDTNSDGATTPAQSAYGGMVTLNGGIVNATYATLRYGGVSLNSHSGTATFGHVNISDGYTAFYIDGGTISATDSTINNFSNNGMEVINGSVLFRGSITGVTNKSVQACDWLANCMVDATYVDWGTDDGPFPSAGSKACGKVFVNPWKTSGGTDSNANIFSTGNCSVSPTPASQLPGKETTFSDMLTDLGIDCGDGMQDACDAITRRTTCMDTAYNLAKSNVSVSFNLPDFSLAGLATGVLTKVSEKVIDDATFDGSGSIFGAVQQGTGLVVQLNGAYDSCLGS